MYSIHTSYLLLSSSPSPRSLAYWLASLTGKLSLRLSYSGVHSPSEHISWPRTIHTRRLAVQHSQESAGLSNSTGYIYGRSVAHFILPIAYGGTLVGALVADALVDRCGLIKAVFSGSLWALLGAVLQASADYIAWVCYARVIAGVGVGASDCLTPVWYVAVRSHRFTAIILS